MKFLLKYKLTVNIKESHLISTNLKKYLGVSVAVHRSTKT
jgi:hypothetical protein